MNNVWRGFKMPESWLRVQKMLEDIEHTNVKLDFATKQFGWQQDLNSLADTLRVIQPYLGSVSRVNDNAENLSKFFEVQAALSRIQVPDYSKYTIPFEKVIPQLSTFDWRWASSALQECNRQCNDTAEFMVTPELTEELDKSVKETFDTTQMERRIKEKFDQWKERHPVLAAVFLTIVLPLLLGLVSGLGSGGITIQINKITNVYVEPSAISEKIVSIPEKSGVVVIDAVPYYYEIIYTDPETGEEFSGYVAKKNVTISANASAEEAEEQEENDTHQQDHE